MARRLKHHAEKEKLGRSVNCPSSLKHGWVQARVGDILKIRNGYAVKSSDYSREGIPLIRQSDINGDTIDISTAKRIPARVMEEYAQYLVRKGDLLIGMSGSLGKIGRYVDEEVAIQNQRTGLLQVKPGFTAGFAKLVLKLVEQQIIAEGKGVVVQNVSAKEIEDCTFPLPPEGQRERIVEEIEKQFTRLDAGVVSLKRVQTALKRYRASVLKAACEGRLVPTEAELARKESRKYETGEQLLRRILKQRREKWNGKGKYKEPIAPAVDLPTLPEGWTWATFEQVARRVTVGHVGPMKHEYVESGIPFLRSQNVRENRFDAEGLLFIRSEFDARLQKSRVYPGDLAVVRSGSVGVTCVIPETLGCANCADLVLIQRPLAFVPEYGAYYMNSLAKRRVDAGKVGVALTHFNTKAVASMPLPLPPRAEQKRIVAEAERRLTTLQDIEVQVTVTVKHSAALRHSILTAAFSSTSRFKQ